jgi:hypothetical protein
LLRHSFVQIDKKRSAKQQVLLFIVFHIANSPHLDIARLGGGEVDGSKCWFRMDMKLMDVCDASGKPIQELW